MWDNFILFKNSWLQVQAAQKIKTCVEPKKHKENQKGVP